MADHRGNPYHDAKGLFSTAAGDADGHPGVSKASQDKNRAIKKAKQRLEQQKVAPRLKKMSEESLRQLAKQQLASSRPSLAKATQAELNRRATVFKDARAASNRNPRTNSRTADDGSVYTNGIFRGPRRRK